LLGPWTCARHAEVGGACFSTVNCVAGLFCDNPNLDIAGSTCMHRKSTGAACAHSNECESLFCRSGACVAATREVAYCPKL
jgi:hypothetical protein